MIRLKTLESDIFVPLLSGILHTPTTRSTYVFINELLAIIPVKEAVHEMYCILSALECLYEIYALRGTIPTINKNVIMQIVENNLYGELKENNKSGFREYAKVFCSIQLDPFNEQGLATVYRQITSGISTTLDNAESQEKTLEDAYSHMPLFISYYAEMFSGELSQIITCLAMNDSKVLNSQYWGWSDFFRKHRIYGGLDLSKLLVLSAAHFSNKTYLVQKDTSPLTSLDQLMKLEEEYIESSVPLAFWGLQAVDEVIKCVPHEITVIVGERGLGKTTLGGFIAGNTLHQKKKVLFYCPEISKDKLLYFFILPAYIRARFGFVVTPQQCLGLEPIYPYGSDLSVDEREAAIKLAKMEFAESGNYYHLDRYFDIKTLAGDLRAKIIEFSPDVLIIDHTTEFRGDDNLNVVTQTLAEVVGDLKKEFDMHIYLLSHTGSDFKVPTKANPIITSKIVAWSKRLEGVADNVLGAFSSQNGRINLFATKLRWAALFPMYLVLRMDRTHSWFTFESADQISGEVSEAQISALTQIASGQDLAMNIVDDDEDEDDDYYSIP